MRILIVEDEPVLRSQLVRALKEENHAVDSAINGEDGLHKILNNLYEVAIIDVMMPKMNGFEVLRNARDRGVNCAILMLTACDTLEDKIQGLDSGADDYLVKPFNLAELKARVRSLLRRKSVSQTNVIRAGDVILDLTLNQVKLNDEVVELTGREFGIIETLLRKKGSVISRSLLDESVIDEVDDSMSNLLDVHICNLRKKLGKDVVKTVRNRGYIVEG